MSAFREAVETPAALVGRIAVELKDQPELLDK
jgi:hypothetical protein